MLSTFKLLPLERDALRSWAALGRSALIMSGGAACPLAGLSGGLSPSPTTLWGSKEDFNLNQKPEGKISNT